MFLRNKYLVAAFVVLMMGVGQLGAATLDATMQVVFLNCSPFSVKVEKLQAITANRYSCPLKNKRIKRTSGLAQSFSPRPETISVLLQWDDGRKDFCSYRLTGNETHVCIKIEDSCTLTATAKLAGSPEYIQLLTEAEQDAEVAAVYAQDAEALVEPVEMADDVVPIAQTSTALTVYQAPLALQYATRQEAPEPILERRQLPEDLLTAIRALSASDDEPSMGAVAADVAIDGGQAAVVEAPVVPGPITQKGWIAWAFGW
jgi:hypothetical protein